MLKTHIKSIGAYLCFIFCFQITQAQIKTKLFTDGIPKQMLPINKEITKLIRFDAPPEFDNLITRSLIAGDRDKSNKFALSLKADLDFVNKAVKTIEGEYCVYTMNIMVKKALNISLELNDFFLSDNAVLSIYTDNELTDSITSSQNNPNKVWATRVYQGNSLNIVLKEPRSIDIGSRFTVSKINLGYKSHGAQFGHPGLAASCNINVVCPTGNGWEEERNSVALIVANGETACTGTLVMNACNDNIPYLLTANHCVEEAGNVTNWVFQFQYWSTQCATNTGMNEDIQYNGCQLRARSAASDFALLQLNQTPPSNSGIRYAGWSRQTTAIQNVTILHHPRGDVMKISRDLNPPVTSTFNGAQCWKLTNDLGATEGGSSGAPYFDALHRIIGQHFGIDDGYLPVCQQVNKYGGRFDLSWTGGGTNTTRLSNWLDPGNTGVMQTTTTNVSALSVPLGSLTISGNSSFCSGSSVYTIPNLPTGATVTWAVTASGAVSSPNPTTGPSTMLTGISNGTATLTATINKASCRPTAVVLTKPVHFGPPIVNQWVNQASYTTSTPPNYYYNSVCPLIPTYVTLQVLGTSTTTWEKVSGTNLNWYISGTDMNFYFFSKNQTAVFKVTATNSCGSTVKYFAFKSIDCGSDPCGGTSALKKFSIFPNPASNNIIITPNTPPPCDVASISTMQNASAKTKNINSNLKDSEALKMKAINSVKIYDLQGRLVKLMRYASVNMQVQIDVTNFANGIYFLEIANNESYERQKLIINR